MVENHNTISFSIPSSHLEKDFLKGNATNRSSSKNLLEKKEKSEKEQSSKIKVNNQFSSLPASTSLFQGNNLLIGFKNVKLLTAFTSIKGVIDDENINILGGIYENTIVDHNQIKRLAQICADKRIYEIFINVLQSNSLNVIGQLTRPLDFDYLLHPHHKMIALFKLLASKKRFAK